MHPTPAGLERSVRLVWPTSEVHRWRVRGGTAYHRVRFVIIRRYWKMGDLVVVYCIIVFWQHCNLSCVCVSAVQNANRFPCCVCVYYFIFWCLHRPTCADNPSSSTHENRWLNIIFGCLIPRSIIVFHRWFLVAVSKNRKYDILLAP